MNSNDIINSRKCHSSNILNITINKGQTKFYSLSDDNQIKVWLLNNTFLHATQEQNALIAYRIPQGLKINFGVENSFFTSFMTFDLCDNLVFLANKNSVYLYKMLNNLLKLNNVNKNDNNLATNTINNDNDLKEIDVFTSVGSITAIELWHSTYSCFLLAGCTSGKIHIFKLQSN